MSYYSPSIEKLIEAFEKLPSIGSKTAARLCGGLCGHAGDRGR